MDCNIRNWKIEDAADLAEPFACNLTPCRILEKNGFQYEGTLRSNVVKNGQVLDMKMYSIIK